LDVPVVVGSQGRVPLRLATDIATRIEPVLVAGDFSATDRSDGYKLLARELTDVHRAAGWGWGHTFPAYGGTWRGLPIPTRLMRLDMIFCSKELVPVACRVALAHGESDHLPVVAQLIWARWHF
jgi:endonuclease/exonuclease/phosphatase family metal-dependent hydrolase